MTYIATQFRFKSDSRLDLDKYVSLPRNGNGTYTCLTKDGVHGYAK